MVELEFDLYYVNENQPLEGLKKDYEVELGGLILSKKHKRQHRRLAKILERRYINYMKILPAQIAHIKRLNYLEEEKQAKIKKLRDRAQSYYEQWQTTKNTAEDMEFIDAETYCVNRLAELIKNKQ